MTRDSIRIRAALLLGLGVLLAGCGQQGVGGPSADTPTSGGARSGHRPPTQRQIVASIGLTRRNAPAPYRTSNSMRSGNVVFGQITLDMCAADFRSENLRVARHQVDFRSADRRSRLSTETVAYRSGGATLAMKEIRHALARCPSGFVRSHVAGVPLFKQRYAPLSVEPGWEPDTIATRVTEIDKSGRSFPGVVIYQRRGNILNGTYAWGTGSAVVHAAERCASLMAEELNAAPAADNTPA